MIPNHLARMGLHICFILSGFSALIYQSLWVRQLSVLFGHTTYAVSIVLASFMAGMAIGNQIGGRLADAEWSMSRWSRYALIEMLIGSFGLFSHHMIRLVPSTSNPIVWIACSFFILAMPSLFIGMTFPLGIRLYPSKIGSLYGTNTLGAVLGVIVAGFYAIEHWGISRTFWVAALINMVVAGLAFLFRSSTISEVFETPQIDHKYQCPSVHKALLSTVLCLSGFAAMSAEVSWTRAIGLTLGSSVTAFSLMLLCFLLGLSLGGFFYQIFKSHFTYSTSFLALSYAFVAFSILLNTSLAGKLPFYLLKLFPLSMNGPVEFMSVQFALTILMMGGPALLMGFTFPMALDMGVRDVSFAGRKSGMLSMMNTLGAIAGSLIGGLFLMPHWGAERSLILTASLYLLCAVLTYIFSSGLAEDPGLRPQNYEKSDHSQMQLRILRGKTSASKYERQSFNNGSSYSGQKFPFKQKLTMISVTALVLSLFTLGVIFRPAWNPYVLSSGVFLYAGDYRQYYTWKDFVQSLELHKLVFYRDGISSSVAVYETTWGEAFLRVNGKTDASSGSDLATQMILGYAPLMFNMDAERALVIGFGSGMSASTLLSSPRVKRIECIEIEPAVLEAGPFFNDVNRHILNDSRFYPIIGDARQYLNHTQNTYDLIISEPSNPWIAGVSNLFTQEAFKAARSRLSSKGVFCQWFHSYSMSQDDFELIMNTFASVFPHVMLFTSAENDFFMLGSLSELSVDYARMSKEFESNIMLKEDLNILKLAHPFSFLSSTFILDDAEFRNFCKNASILTDDRPTLEFTAPRSLHRGEYLRIRQNLMAAKTHSLPPTVRDFNPSKKEWVHLHNLAGEALMRVRDVIRAEVEFKKALELDSNNARTWCNIARIHSAKDQPLRAIESFQKSLQFDPSYAVAYFHLGMIYLSQGFEDRGLSMLEKGLHYSPFDPMGSFQAAQIYAYRGQNNKAEKLLTSALAKPVLNSELYTNMVGLLRSIKNPVPLSK